MYRISQIKVEAYASLEDIKASILRKLAVKNAQFLDFQLIKESIDARDKTQIKKVYTVDFNLTRPGKEATPIKLKPSQKLNLSIAPDMTYHFPQRGTKQLKERPVVVGFGPCGMFAALILAEAGYAPMVIERGKAAEERARDVELFWEKGILNIESNVQFGEGGAGTFSDGKLTTGIKDFRIRKMLEEFVEAEAPSEILYKQKPHIGTDVLRIVVANIRKKIISLGGEIRFNTKMVSIKQQNGKLEGIEIVRIDEDGNSASEIEEIRAEQVILAVGHSARDTFRYLHGAGIKMSQKPFSIGVRVEHPQSLIDKSQYGDFSDLPPADYKLVHHCENGRGVYTFCMCPGGEVIMAASQKNTVVTNGMSNYKRDSGTANSGLLVDARTRDFGDDSPLAGIVFQEKYEQLAFINGGSSYKPPRALWGDFKERNEHAQPVINSLPDFVVESIIEAMPHLGRKLKGFDNDNVIMTAVETRSSSPVRFARDENFQSNIKGLYPAGEGAGYAGGITSSACDGIKIAEKIISEYNCE